MTELDLLWDYQQADMEVDRFEAELKGSKRRKQLLKLKKYLTEQQDVLHKMEGTIEQMAGRIAALTAQHEQCQAAIAGIASDIEALGDAEEIRSKLTDARHSAELMARAERELSRIHKEAEAMERQQKDIVAHINKGKADYAAIKEEYDKELAAVSGQLDDLRRTREERKAGISPQLLAKYNSIKLHANPPMATLLGDQCGGCNMSLPAVVMQSMRTPGKIVECENCGRILVLPS